MLTLFKEIFTWWNHQTLGTRLTIFFFGKFVGSDESGNKYYETKKGKRFIIYNGEVDASKFQMIGIPGCTLLQIKLKILMN